ncbi:SDR family NAD(P)-dependent oxidoreductase [Alkalicoccus luteus]|uniref:SDR family NAD(P)-dependent oxidoreductase n=1 Tax=Alkalicoccus luteus TaxID=1237094 RepID=A0A969TW51_9BACI|nr:SDR family NAD(P)-dependent oxidoreductase [Alkalicoccus luteus]NJP38812.1 SDR family NAD(P)-dependent oxidoreductase [Alkalicoccus luteus]
MKQSLHQKIVVITGASTGIGEQIAYAAAAKGALPILVARTEARLEAAKEKVKQRTGIVPIVKVCDVSDVSAVQYMIHDIEENTGPIFSYIHNAGFGAFDYAEDVDLKQAEEMFQLNVISGAAAAKFLIPNFKARREGSIIFTGSISSRLPTPKTSIYSATKHAVAGYADALRMELKPYGIHVGVLMPGPVDTSFFDTADESGRYKENIEKIMLAPEAVGRAAVELVTRRKRVRMMPWWMGAAARAYQLAPALIEKIGGNAFKQK